MGSRHCQGYIGMDKVREILRLHEQGINRTNIARACEVTRHTVRDYIRRASAAGIDYAKLSALSDGEIKACFGKKQAGRRHEQAALDCEGMQRELLRKSVTLQLLWEEYLREHPSGYSYSNYCNHYRQWRKSHKLSMRQDYKAGEKGFVDYAGQTIEIVDSETGEVSSGQLFILTLGASNYTYAEVTAGQDLEHWIGSHVRAFQYFGGVPEILVPDNLASGVTTVCRYEPGINRTYQEFAEHYQLAIIPARAKHPRDKAKAEEAVQNAERRLLAPLRNQTFTSVGDINQALKPLLFALNDREMQTYGCSRREMFEKLELPALRPLPTQNFSISSWKEARVNIDYHIEVKRHYYSVPYKLVHEQVRVRITEQVIEVLHQGKRVALHHRSDTPGKHTTLKEHMPAEHQFMQDWTPSRLQAWAEKIGPETLTQVDCKLGSRQHPEQAYRACLGLLSLAKKYGNERVEAACKQVNRFGPVPYATIKALLVSGADKVSVAKTPDKPISNSNVRGAAEFH